MERHQQIRKEQALIYKKFETNDINIDEFVVEMNKLNKVLIDVEQNMYDNYDTSILTFDKKINNLEKENKQLTSTVSLLKISNDKSSKQHTNMVKKDKYIYKLKEGVKTWFLNFNEELLPKNYLRISKQFPHLNLQEIIDFEKKVIENGGSIPVHKGKYILTDRSCSHAGNGHSTDQRKILLSWSCCGVDWGFSSSCCRSYSPRYRVTIPGCNVGNGSDRMPYIASYKDRNPSPNDILFHLNETNDKLQDIKKVCLSDISSSIAYNVEILEKTIDESSKKILKMKGFQETLNLFMDGI